VTGHAAESGITQSLTQYDRLVPQCLLIAPSYADLSALRTVLAELGFTAMTTMQLLVGAQLATVPLDEFAFAVAVLPPSRSDGAPGAASATIFLEAGIALGRGLPLIVLAEDPDEDLPVFGGLASNVWTVVNAKDEASIRLHLTLFTKVLETHGPPGDSEPLLPASAASVKPSTETIGGRARDLEEAVVGLLRACGAQVESEAISSGGDQVDAVALIPGTEHVLGPVLIEVKTLRGRGLSAAVDQLGAYVVRSRAMSGLVVYDGPRQGAPGPASGFPIAVMHIDELREHVRDGTLGSALVYNRNSAMHGSA
jgi:hypothetical protein